MDKKTIIKLFLLIITASFIISYVIGISGYYEYELANKRILTEEKMKEFETAVENGEKVDLKDYSVNTHRDYTNKFTKSVTNASLTLNKYLKKTIEKTFNLINKMVEE